MALLCDELRGTQTRPGLLSNLSVLHSTPGTSSSPRIPPPPHTLLPSNPIQYVCSGLRVSCLNDLNKPSFLTPPTLPSTPTTRNAHGNGGEGIIRERRVLVEDVCRQRGQSGVVVKIQRPAKHTRQVTL